MSWVAVAIGGVQAFGQLQQGYTARHQAAIQAEENSYQAGVAQDEALETAKLIRRAGAKTQGAAAAAYAGAGVKVGEGSAAEVEREIVTGVEHDAYQAILEGNRRGRALRLEGMLNTAQGRQAQQASYYGAAGSVLSGYNNGQRQAGWRTVNKG